MKGSGGTEGGIGKFWLGMLLAGIAIYLFVDSTKVVSGGGYLSGMMSGHRGGMGRTGNFAIILAPLVIGLIWLFTNYKSIIGRVLACGGLAVFVFEIISGLHFYVNMKTSWLLILVVMFCAGCGMMLSSYRKSER